MGSNTQATTTEPTREHTFDAVEPGDAIRLDLTNGAPTAVYGTVVSVDRFDADDVRELTIDTRTHGRVFAHWYGAVEHANGDRVGRHVGETLRLDTQGNADA